MSEKPHKGQIEEWHKEPCTGGLGFLIVGRFLDHPERLMALDLGGHGHTSFVVAHDKKTGEIETKNSRYTLVGETEH